MHNNLIILAGGMSSRMKKPSTSKNINKEKINEANSRSKSLIGVGKENRPLMDYLLYNAKKAGYKNIYIVINKNGNLFKTFYGTKSANNEFKGLNISFPIQKIPDFREKPFGTADAVYQAIEQFPKLKKESFTVCNSDNLYSIKVLELLRNSESVNSLISYDRKSLEFSLEKIYSFAIMNLDKQNYLKDIIEKPTKEEAENYQDKDGKIRVSMNIFKLDGPIIFEYLKNCPIHPKRNEKELPTVVLNCIKDHPKSFLTIPVSEHVPDLTAKDDISIVKKYIDENYPTNLAW
ncbi:sugar phosphate nucleotidyltransferase [Polaribacter sp. MED152]|uniref:sugar phosphate nucleotidyltransferase n=1 Tax=Polaribacter sp. MED152 TaxID=313598 RepID=UPI000068C87B|nr:sugar phosphate nucleotidyltransferase [Polaribacter sp. MED152]EAQ41998.1 nucleotidyltransferase family protein [Polaribacter sp. MED152]